MAADHACELHGADHAHAQATASHSRASAALLRRCLLRVGWPHTPRPTLAPPCIAATLRSHRTAPCTRPAHRCSGMSSRAPFMVSLALTTCSTLFTFTTTFARRLARPGPLRRACSGRGHRLRHHRLSNNPRHCRGHMRLQRLQRNALLTWPPYRGKWPRRRRAVRQLHRSISGSATAAVRTHPPGIHAHTSNKGSPGDLPPP